MKRACFIFLSVSLVVCLAGSVFAQDTTGEMVEWPYVGADQAASKYSPLTDINTTIITNHKKMFLKKIYLIITN